MNEDELHLVQIKAIINNEGVVDKIITFFKRTDAFLEKGRSLDRIHSIVWWASGRNTIRIVIYESENSPPKYLERLKRNKIQVIPFRDILNEIVKYISQKDGVKEDNPVMRFMHFLHEYKLLKQIDDQEANKAFERTR
ncbi:MAG: hypothetical protein ABSA97_01925 [Verrucomicrobiia bacterium]